MMALLLAMFAHAEPPRGEVIVGWSGNQRQNYGFLAVQPALLRSPDASFVLRGTVSQLYYTFHDDLTGVNHVESPGVSVGPAFTYTPGDFAFGMAVGLGARRSTRVVESDPTFTPVTTIEPDATLSGDIYWRPRQRAQVYGGFSFTAANPYLWLRVGASHPIVPFDPVNAPVSLWLGFEGSNSGPFASRLLELSPVLEVPVRDLRTVFSVRAGMAFEEHGDGYERQGYTGGLGIYWAY
jgi:hypothetical protein